MVSTPVPSMRSMRLCENDTSLIRPSGMSRPLRENTPERMMTRSLVNT
jgi:hypothetical protein